MLIPVSNLIKNYAIRATGVLHVGAHMWEEAADYEKFGWLPIYWVDAYDYIKEASQKLSLAKPDEHHFYQGLIWGTSGLLKKFHKANNGASSSVFNLGTHQKVYKDVVYSSSEFLSTITLNDLLPKNISFDFVNLDIQGAELQALKGLGDRLNQVKYIYTEVNKKYLYEQINLLYEIEIFLRGFGFERVVTKWVEGAGWGDAVFIRRDILAKMTYRQRIKIKVYFYFYSYEISNLHFYIKKFANFFKQIVP